MWANCPRCLIITYLSLFLTEWKILRKNKSNMTLLQQKKSSWRYAIFPLKTQLRTLQKLKCPSGWIWMKVEDFQQPCRPLVYINNIIPIYRYILENLYLYDIYNHHQKKTTHNQNKNLFQNQPPLRFQLIPTIHIIPYPKSKYGM